MNPDALERLMLDDSLGALDGDARALLHAYLQHEPAAARSANELDEIVRRAGAALRPEGVGDLPPFPAARLDRAQRTIRRIRFAGRAAALAACIGLGIGIGANVPRDAGPATPEQSPLKLVEAGDKAGSAENDFWSARRMLDRAGVQRRPPAWSWRTVTEKPVWKGAT